MNTKQKKKKKLTIQTLYMLQISYYKETLVSDKMYFMYS